MPWSIHFIFVPLALIFGNWRDKEERGCDDETENTVLSSYTSNRKSKNPQSIFNAEID